MMFLTLLTVLRPERAGEELGVLKRISTVEPPTGIRIVGVYSLFGRYDAALIFEAPNERMAKAFVSRLVRAGGYRAETMLAIPAEEL